MLDYAHTYGLKTIVFRQSSIYGPRQFGREDQGWLAWFSIRAFQERPVTIYGDGKQVRDVLYIKDLVEAYDAAVRNIQTTAGQAYNIGGGPSNTLSLLELVEMLDHESPAQAEVFLRELAARRSAGLRQRYRQGLRRFRMAPGHRRP